MLLTANSFKHNLSNLEVYADWDVTFIVSHLFARDLKTLLRVRLINNIFEDGGKRCYSYTRSDQNGYIVLVPVLVTFSERTIQVQLQSKIVTFWNLAKLSYCRAVKIHFKNWWLQCRYLRVLVGYIEDQSHEP